ncbi:MAG: class I SAM-dependent methyltransferase [Aphanizomenon gracile PMC627.10]|nr:class I SAM-dependent methyltransferase [Aphanizomenon gracile PMC627.10]
MKQKHLSCPVCNSAMKSKSQDWIYRCVKCNFRMSTLRPDFKKSHIQSISSNIDESKREISLKKLRNDNFKIILDSLEKLANKSSLTLLDVGCAHGWFLELATKRGFESYGLEPDFNVFDYSQIHSKVWQGFFPDDLPNQPKIFDIIIFNDVFEHLPDCQKTLQSCYDLLPLGGLLVINLPSSQGIFYRIAEFLSLCKIHKPLERMWQKDFVSPHIYYFSPNQLSLLCKHYKFKEIYRLPLPSISISGLWSRLRFDQTSPLLLALVAWVCIFCISPLLKLLPKDIEFLIFRKI